MSYLKQLKCPSCGATLNQDFPNQLIVECPYCHQQVVNDTYQLFGKNNEPRILEFRMTENEVVEQMVNLLIGNKDVPTDIFDKMDFTSIEKYYVPMYIFEGTFRAPWTAERSRQEKRQKIGRDGKMEDYYETLYDYFNGEAAGNFSVNGIPSNEITRLKLNYKSIQDITVNPSQLSPFSKVQIHSDDSIEILTPSSESDSVWWESGEATAQNIGVDTACSQAPGNVTSCSACCELKRTSFVFIPFWIIRYKYNDEMYSSVFYAEQFMDYNHPKGANIEAQPTEEQQVKLDKYHIKNNIISNIRTWGCLIVLLFIAVSVVGSFFMIEFLDWIWYKYGFSVILYGIGFWVVTWVVGYIVRRIDGIDDIEADIANRTLILQTEADSYRQETGKMFLNSFVGTRNQSDICNSAATAFANSTPLYDANPAKTKTCVRCSKQIDVHHMYCRYCGAKQN